MVAAVDGLPDRRLYRRFRIRTVEGADDPRSIAEVIDRRYTRVRDEGKPLPGLILIDGGITQLRAAREALARLGLSQVPAVGLAEEMEEIVLDDGRPPLLLPATQTHCASSPACATKPTASRSATTAVCATASSANPCSTISPASAPPKRRYCSSASAPSTALPAPPPKRSRPSPVSTASWPKPSSEQ